jgi:hypothetical protein
MKQSESARAWERMKEEYRAMGLTEEEIAKRIICKTTRVINRKGKLGECDHKGEGKDK